MVEDDAVADGEGITNVAAVLEEHKHCMQWRFALMAVIQQPDTAATPQLVNMVSRDWFH
jgi:hypothetical protein